MADHSKIEWTEATWNPIAGCSVVSPGCTNCYAMRTVAPRLSANPATPHYAGTVAKTKAGSVWTGKIGVAPESVLLKPLAWKRPRMIFVNSTSDLFHEAVPDEVIDRIFAVMALCPQHTFQVLTKRTGRALDYFGGGPGERWGVMNGRVTAIARSMRPQLPKHWTALGADSPRHIWFGFSAEDQQRYLERRDAALSLAGAFPIFLSAEPLLGPIDLGFGTDHCDLCGGTGILARWPKGRCYICGGRGRVPITGSSRRDGYAMLSWVIVGGESGKGARPMHPDWARSLRDQCAAAGVPFFFKQWGEWAPAMFGTDPDNAHVLYQMEKVGPFDSWKAPVFDPDCYEGINWRRLGKKIAGRLLDGVTHDAMPSPGAARHPLPQAGEGKVA